MLSELPPKSAESWLAEITPLISVDVLGQAGMGLVPCTAAEWCRVLAL